MFPLDYSTTRLNIFKLCHLIAPMQSYTMVVTCDMCHRLANVEILDLGKVRRLKAYKVSNLNLKKTKLKPDLVYLFIKTL